MILVVFSFWYFVSSIGKTTAYANTKSYNGNDLCPTNEFKSKKAINVLAFDGGGSRGIMEAMIADDLMRIFGSESMNTILEKLGLKDGESIDHPWINKALERAQQKVESRNFDIRKTLLKFDNVLNDQRQVIFSQRNIPNQNKIAFFFGGGSN